VQGRLTATNRLCEKPAFMWNFSEKPEAAVMEGLSSNDFRSAAQTA